MRVSFLVLLLALVAGADTVYLKGGKKLEGLVVSEGSEVVVNSFNSAVPGMTLGVERVAADRVKRVVRTLPPPYRDFHKRLAAATVPDDFLELARWCDENKLKEERLYALERLLRLDPANEEARRLLGSKAPKGNWREQYELARKYLDAEDEDDRSDALAAIRADHAFPWSETYLKRALRSKGQPKGYQEDRAVAMRADKLMANARYTMLVPESYRPLEPTPLVIGLHGGGAGGADGKLVVGSGKDAINFYRSECEQLGWICACPDALVAGWGGKPNDELIDAILDELRGLYNVDENRIYLVGHSMGGGGTWAQGTRIPEVWAAIAPCASFGVHGIDRLKKTGTPFYVYHSDNDPRTRVEGVRPYMLNLAGTDVDFVYTELPGQGHGFPSEVRKDIFFEFFATRVLASGRGRPKPQVRPLSSFLRKVSRDEKKYLPELPVEGEAGGATDALSTLLKELRTGGGVAEAAVAKLIAHEDPKTSSRVAKILLKAQSTPDVRRYAAQVLGGRKAVDEIKSLGRVLLIEVDSDALLAAVEALGAIGDPSAGDHLIRFLKKRAEYLAKRTQGGELDKSDWDAILPPMAAACTHLGSLGVKSSAPVIVETVLDGILLSTDGVVYDTATGTPLPVAQGLAAAACEALARLRDPVALPALRKMEAASRRGTTVAIQDKYGPVKLMTHWSSDARIAGYVREAIQALTASGAGG